MWDIHFLVRSSNCDIISMFIFTVDTQAPTISCPSDINNQVTCGTTNTQVSFNANAFDNCGSVTVVYSSTGSTIFNQQSQSTASVNVGTSQITARATDSGGRQATCTFQVTIIAGIVRM